MYNINLGIDYGLTRIGIARSDPAGKYAIPLDFIKNDKNAVATLKQLIEEYEVSKLFVGAPVKLDGVKSKMQIKAERFIEQLGFDGPIVYIDERFSSVESNKILIDQGLNPKQSRKKVDGLAASIILEQGLAL
jgi:putative Holliday junction resolvase